MTNPIDLTAERVKRKSKHVSPPREGWEANLHIDGFGRVKRSLANVMTILINHPAWHEVLAYDAFGDVVLSTTPPPVRDSDRPRNHSAGVWTDADTVRTAAWLSGAYLIDPGIETVEHAVATVAKKNPIHPVRDYLRSLRWDAIQRLPTLLSSYFGAEPTGYAEAIGVRWMVSAVARVEQPGCKADHMLVLEGEQGIGKSTALSILAGQWFADTGIVLGDKDSYQALRRVWLYEFAELSSLRSARDVERVKSFVSSPSDHYRPSYGRRTIDFPRQCVFAGSTNEDTYLSDRSGNRRFWPVKCGRIDLDGLRCGRDQLWAEAYARYSSGERWHVDSYELAAACREQQEEREHVDPWLQFLAEWLEEPTIPDENQGFPARTRLHLERGITTADALVGAIAMKRDRIERGAEMRMGQCLKSLGWERRRVRTGATRAWLYFPVSLPVPTSIGEGEAIE